MAREKCPICDSDVDFNGGNICPTCGGDKRNAADDNEVQQPAGDLDLAGLDALVAAPAAPANPAPATPLVVPVRPVIMPRGGVVIDDDDDDDDDNNAPVPMRVAARPAVVRPGVAAAPAPAPTASVPASVSKPRSNGGNEMADDTSHGKGKGKEDGKGEKKEEKKETPPPPKPAPPKPIPVATLAVTEPKPSGRCVEEHWQVIAVAEVTNVRKGGMQIFCNGKLVSCPDAVGPKLRCEIFLPGGAGKVFVFTTKHSPSGVEAGPVTIKTETVKSQVRFAWFHKLCDWIDDAIEDKSEGGKQ